MGPQRIGREHERLVCIGHRGAKGLEPENTLRSIELAIELGCGWIEIDVWRVENELVVFHDRRLDRCTNGTGLLTEASLATIRSLDAGKGERVPLLVEVLDLVRGRAALNVEVKGPNVVDALSRELRTELDLGTPLESLLVSSFDHVQLEAFKQRNPDIRVGALTCGFPRGLAAYAETLEAWSANVSIDFVDADFIADAHGRGLRVLVYTVNELDDIRAMDALGVDAIFSDYPDRVLEYLKAS